MNKTYCPTCGAPNQYSYSKPKFCGECGSAFASVAPKKVAENNSNEKNEVFERYKKVFARMGVDVDGQDAPPKEKKWDNLKKLSYKSVEADDGSQSFKFGELIDQGLVEADRRKK